MATVCTVSTIKNFEFCNWLGSKFKAIIRKTFDEVKLPVPPQKVREQVVKECEAVDASAGDIVNTGIPLKQVGEEMQRRKVEVFKKYL
jgi:hypothetical protein